MPLKISAPFRINTGTNGQILPRPTPPVFEIPEAPPTLTPAIGDWNISDILDIPSPRFTLQDTYLPFP